MAKTIADYKMLRDELTKEYGDDLSKWTREYDSICRIQEVIELASRVTGDKVKELAWRNANNAVDNNKITELLNKN